MKKQTALSRELLIILGCPRFVYNEKNSLYSFKISSRSCAQGEIQKIKNDFLALRVPFNS